MAVWEHFQEKRLKLFMQAKIKEIKKDNRIRKSQTAKIIPLFIKIYIYIIKSCEEGKKRQSFYGIEFIFTTFFVIAMYKGMEFTKQFLKVQQLFKFLFIRHFDPEVCIKTCKDTLLFLSGGPDCVRCLPSV